MRFAMGNAPWVSVQNADALNPIANAYTNVKKQKPLNSVFILLFLPFHTNCDITWPLAKINPFMLAGIDPLVAQRMTGWEKGETGCPSQLGLSWLGREW